VARRMGRRGGGGELRGLRNPEIAQEYEK